MALYTANQGQGGREDAAETPEGAPAWTTMSTPSRVQPKLDLGPIHLEQVNTVFDVHVGRRSRGRAGRKRDQEQDSIGGSDTRAGTRP
jgi:hypothetical protein